MRRKMFLLLIVVLTVLMLIASACGSVPGASDAPVVSEEEKISEGDTVVSEAYVDTVSMDMPEIENELAVVAEAPEAPRPDILNPEASGILVKENEKARIDYSNTRDGYVMILFTRDTEKRLKTQIKGPDTTYTYNLYKGEWAVLPLTDGNGDYQFKVFQNVSGNEYSLVLAEKCEVTLADEFAPFLRPNQYVDYGNAELVTDKAWELTKAEEDPLGKVEIIYDFVVSNMTYDKERAATVKSGYIPLLDEVLAEKKGICFDYAALMTGMLRSQGIPCKMIFGYAGSAYHAWISVWTEDTGWVDGVIFFDGQAWQRLDPTLASAQNQSDSIMEFISDGGNYKEKYFY